MLPFQVFRASPQFSCNQFIVSHFLSCGSYRTPFSIQNLHQFSKYKVNPFSKFTNSEKKEGKDTVFIVMKGEGKFDGKIVPAFGFVMNPVEVSATDKVFQFVRVTFSSEAESQIWEKSSQNQVVRKDKWVVSKFQLKEGEELRLNQNDDKRVFVFLNKGEISVEKKLHPLTQLESVLIHKSTIVKANKASYILVVQLFM